jgi:hypothetical protein
MRPLPGNHPPHYYGRDFETTLAGAGICLLRPARKGEPARPGTRFFKPLRQIIESVNQTFKGQLDLERRVAGPRMGHKPQTPCQIPALCGKRCTSCGQPTATAIRPAQYRA